MLHACLYKNAELLNSRLREVIGPRLMHTLSYKNVVEIDLGPFKQKNDLGLPLRRLALDCIEDVLLSGVSGAMNYGALVEAAPKLLLDDETIRLHTHKLLVKLSQHSPALVTSSIDALVEPLSKTLFAKIPETKKGPELERATEVIRSAVKLSLVMDAIPELRNVPKWSELMAAIKKNASLSELSENLKNASLS